MPKTIFQSYKDTKTRFKNGVITHRTHIAILSLVALIVHFFFYLELTDINWHGFGVDSAGRIYVGHHRTICIYEGGKKVDEFTIPKYSSYYLTVINDEIRIAGNKEKLTYSLQGTLLSSDSDPNQEFYKWLKNRPHALADGKRYTARNILGFYWVTTPQGKVIYTRALADSISTFLLYTALPISMIVIICLAFKTGKTNPASKKTLFSHPCSEDDDV